MKIFLESKRGLPLDRSTAHTCVILNFLALPGLGSWLAGRKVGIFQAILALVGFVLTLIWAIDFAIAWASLRQFPMDGGRHFRLGVHGVLSFIVAWVWALVTSLSILHAARKS